jgi:hypothetical protein
MNNLHHSWFAVLGQATGPDEGDAVAGYLRGLGLDAATPIRAVQSWQEAGQLTRQPAGLWWAREETERKRLEAQVGLRLSDADLVTLTDSLHGAAAVAAARAGCADPGLIKAAAGSAFYAAYQYRLACAANSAEDHPFMRKYALFAAGRWPLGLIDAHYALF